MIDHMKLKGEFSSRRIWLDGKELLPNESRRYRNHSPDGFNWGYAGSGPAQLALALLLHLSKDNFFALKYYQAFKNEFIAKLPAKDFEFDAMIMMDWIEAIKKGKQ